MSELYLALLISSSPNTKLSSLSMDVSGTDIRGCKYTTTPSTHQDFWQKKFAANVSNDKKHYRQLKDLGWHVIVLWECEIEHTFFEVMNRVINDLKIH
jgi:G:T-mismatch repair DNA endonuclease (very short patch repair protein)